MTIPVSKKFEGAQTNTISIFILRFMNFIVRCYYKILRSRIISSLEKLHSFVRVPYPCFLEISKE